MTQRIWSTDRRTLLKAGALGVGALTLNRLLSACGGSSNTDPLNGPITSNMSVVQRWVPDQLGPGSVRLPVSLANNSGLLLKGPAILNAKVTNLDNSVIVDGLIAERRFLVEGAPPFWVFTADIVEVDTYFLIVQGGPADGAAFQIGDVAELIVPRRGDALPSLETPTVENHRGVEPYCTRVPEPCPFHDLTLAQAVNSGKRVVLIVGTPAHCETAVCAPVLDGLITMAKDFPDVAFVHVDVYSDKAGTTVAPSVQELKLTFDPALWITDIKGMITQRFDGVWHPDEVRAALNI